MESHAYSGLLIVVKFKLIWGAVFYIVLNMAFKSLKSNKP